MDAFSVCLDALSLVGQAVTHLLFVLRLTGKRRKLWYFAGYLSLLCAIELGFRRFVPGGGVLPVGAGILALYGMVRFALGKRRSASWLAAVLAFYVSQLSFGIVNSVESVFFAPFVGSPLLYPLLLAALAGGFALCAGCYAAVLRLLSLEEVQPPPRMGLLLFPGLFSLAAELYILRTSYSFPASSLPPEEAGRHGALLFLQIMGLAALLCTLYAYRRLVQGFQAQAALQALEELGILSEKGLRCAEGTTLIAIEMKAGIVETSADPDSKAAWLHGFDEAPMVGFRSLDDILSWAKDFREDDWPDFITGAEAMARGWI